MRESTIAAVNEKAASHTLKHVEKFINELWIFIVVLIETVTVFSSFLTLKHKKHSSVYNIQICLTS
jgi:hypothetical protein